MNKNKGMLSTDTKTEEEYDEIIIHVEYSHITKYMDETNCDIKKILFSVKDLLAKHIKRVKEQTRLFKYFEEEIKLCTEDAFKYAITLSYIGLHYIHSYKRIPLFIIEIFNSDSLTEINKYNFNENLIKDYLEDKDGLQNKLYGYYIYANNCTFKLYCSFDYNKDMTSKGFISFRII